jgi:hypothetical protein
MDNIIDSESLGKPQGDKEEKKVEYAAEDFLAAISDMNNDRLRQFGLDSDANEVIEQEEFATEVYFEQIQAHGVSSFLQKVKQALSRSGYEILSRNEAEHKKSGKIVIF